ncbi:MAG: preprotein translocase subunit SecA [Gallionellales bacterium 35-53-114]|jgi:preprotein translocase subunit SecA|nr:MAG: preprotein translocase subunit SecA [Gallionellales bacterium 35-53-114]OYZ63902.1 MAG: preprotein translocase subunit SecA [Gallionellales bacterium 24-53-125]OZB09267.1 MAG: preprotein translocase subunit SecA [Gallionellales bacterium 39-52-133]HQS59126.1 preprotein translocase subunit SecA [Gallionellaceae bacterium]HQS75862.1 preprotein translocase subunit SecA [Gallionellaceae bacterium]
MISNLLKSVFGSRNDRLLKQYRQTVIAINALEPQIEALTDDELRAMTANFRQRVQQGESLDALLPEAFAVVREGGKRALQMRHFDVQLIGGMVLHYGKIAEMRTGEGKTLMATLPAYLNALSGKGVHVVTVNDYLARRDAEWMGRLYRFLGLSVGVILSQMDPADKQAAYASDITYGTNNEYGFDYLRDNMATETGERYQRGLNFAIVDEVDSILIDEARTPLIISGQAEDNVDVYTRMNKLVPQLVKQQEEDGEGDYSVDEKNQQILLTETGHEHAEELLGKAGLLPPGGSLYDPANITLIHNLYAALKAHVLYHIDQNYVVQNGEVVIVDEFTGRMMPGRRWSDGLHQAVEAKEGVAIQKENQTLASITFQNFFRMYNRLSGMTGTADTEAYEFQSIYGLETVVVPPHRPTIRVDMMDQVYLTAMEKYKAVINDIRDCYQRGQPVLVGTTSIETSELLSSLLDKEKLPHQVLNAKQHAREAEIVAQAGRPQMVTIATNMAGRGTDIVLGGNVEKQIELVRLDASLDDGSRAQRIVELRAEWQPVHDQVVASGGLHIIGTERHESRRVDNQLRGRAGRQGDPGSSRFYLSLEDPLLRIFASDRVAAIMNRFKLPEGEAIEHTWVTRAIENAQRKVEARNFDMRKQILEYDDVANDQRKVIYQQRNELMDSLDISETIAVMRDSVLHRTMNEYITPGSMEEQWDVAGLEHALKAEYELHLPVAQWLEQEKNLDEEGVRDRVLDAAQKQYQVKVEHVGAEVMHRYERLVMLQSLDTHWREHLGALDHLRQGIHLRGYAQKNPKQEYKREAFELFSNMLESVKTEVTQILMNVQIRSEQDIEAAEVPHAPSNVQYHHADYEEALGQTGADEGEEKAPFVRTGEKIGRNDPCPCGSGKKYKQCHGKLS